jgi:hypothetical protein
VRADGCFFLAAPQWQGAGLVWGWGDALPERAHTPDPHAAHGLIGRRAGGCCCCVAAPLFRGENEGIGPQIGAGKTKNGRVRKGRDPGPGHFRRGVQGHAQGGMECVRACAELLLLCGDRRAFLFAAPRVRNPLARSPHALSPLLPRPTPPDRQGRRRQENPAGQRQGGALCLFFVSACV